MITQESEEKPTTSLDERLNELIMDIRNTTEYDTDYQSMLSEAIILIDQNHDMHKTSIKENTKYFNKFLKPFNKNVFKQKTKTFYNQAKKQASLQLDNILIQTLETSLNNITGIIDILKELTVSLIDKLHTYQTSQLITGVTKEVIINEDYDRLEELTRMNSEELTAYYIMLDKANLKTNGVLFKDPDCKKEQEYVMNANLAITKAYELIKKEALTLKKKGIKNEQLKALNEQLIQHASTQEKYTRLINKAYEDYDKYK